MTASQPLDDPAGLAADTESGVVSIPLPGLVVAPGLVPDDPRTGEPLRPRTVQAATVLCWLAVAITGAAVAWIYWDAVANFANASWLMGQFVTAPGSLERVLLSVAVTVIGLAIGASNAIVGYYAWAGYAWTRFAGLISATVTVAAIVLNPLAWAAIPAAAIGAALLWLPPARRFFTTWRGRRHPEQVLAAPVVDVVYGPLPRYR